MLRFTIAICCLTLVAGDQDKWVWSSRSRSNSDYLRGEHSVAIPVTSNKGTINRPLFKARDDYRVENKYRDEPIDNDGAINQPRYEVFEGGDDNRPPPPSFQSRPPPSLPIGQPRPPPLSIYPGERPINRPPLPPPPPGPVNPLSPIGPQGNHPAPGILTGPVPSWEHRPPYKNNDPTNFDHCKCVHSFNCKSPGLKFSSCDIGKTYCCYNDEGYGLQNVGLHGAFGAGGRPGGHGPAVLVGPSNPSLNRRPDFFLPPGDRPFTPPLGPGRPPFLDRPEQSLGPVPFDYLDRSAKGKRD